jgi:hypothetical protein
MGNFLTKLGTNGFSKRTRFHEINHIRDQPHFDRYITSLNIVFTTFGDSCLLGFYSIKTAKQLPTFRRRVAPSPSASSIRKRTDLNLESSSKCVSNSSLALQYFPKVRPGHTQDQEVSTLQNTVPYRERMSDLPIHPAVSSDSLRADSHQTRLASAARFQHCGLNCTPTSRHKLD